MPTSFAMAVLADFGWARIDVMKPSDNMTDCSQKFELVIGSAPEILFRDRLFERIRFVKFHGGVQRRRRCCAGRRRKSLFSSEKIRLVRQRRPGICGKKSDSEMGEVVLDAEGA